VARDPNQVPNADKFDPSRQQPDISAYGYGQHECFGKQLTLAYLTGLVKLSASLKNLRPAPGAMGVVKTINVRPDTIYLNDSWSYFGLNANSERNSRDNGLRVSAKL
jgi:linoleate 10R-lipoxygenase